MPFRIVQPAAETVAAAMGLQMTPTACAWQAQTVVPRTGGVLVVSPWRGEHYVGVAKWGIRNPRPNEEAMYVARFESLSGNWWRQGIDCVVIATRWLHRARLSDTAYYDTWNGLPDGSPFALLARGKVEDNHLSIALVSREGGGTNAFLPKRIPYAVALKDALLGAGAVPPLNLDFGSSRMLNPDGTPHSHVPPESRLDRLYRMVEESRGTTAIRWGPAGV